MHTNMRNTVILCYLLCVLYKTASTQNVVVDGTITENEYGPNSKLVSVNTTWHAYVTDTQLCVGIEAPSSTNLTNILIALTFDASNLLNASNAFPTWYGFTAGNCGLTDYNGVVVGPGTITADASTLQVREFCLSHTGMSQTGSRSIYFQGKVFDNNGTIFGYSPSNNGFYGVYLDGRVPVGLDSNLNSFPYASTSNGDWNSGVVWNPGMPASIADPSYAATHAILLTNVTITSTSVFVAHLTQLTNSTLHVVSGARMQIGAYQNDSYWEFQTGNNFVSDSDAVITFYTPNYLISSSNDSIILPSITLDSLSNTQTFSVPYGWSANSVQMVRNVVVNQRPTSLSVLRYSGTASYVIGKELPMNSYDPCWSMLIIINRATALIIDGVDGIQVSMNPPAGGNITLSSILVQNGGSFLYGGSYSNNTVLPQLTVLNGITLNGTGQMQVSSKLYAASIDGAVKCTRDDTTLIFVLNGSDYQSWPPLELDTSHLSLSGQLELSKTTNMTVLNGYIFNDIEWHSDADGLTICNGPTCAVPAKDATITITGVGQDSYCLSSKDLPVLYSGTTSKKNTFPVAYVVGPVIAAVALMIIAAVVIFVVLRRRVHEMEPDSEMDSLNDSQNVTGYNPIAALSDKAPNHDLNRDSKQPLIDPKYEIPYNEITFGPELGKGAFGVVYKCRWRNTDTVVKQMDINKKDTASVELFLKEAANVLKLRTHPNVCTVFGVCTDPRYPICILMEYLPDGSLDNLIYHNKIKIDAQIVLELARDIASGMSHLHKENVLHCDLACRNLLVTTQKDKHIVKIADFGLSRITEKDSYNASASSTFPIRWTAPETLRSGKISRASDIWSFGVVLWEIIEGKRPYPELSNTDVMKAVCDKGYRLPRPDRVEIPTQLWHLIQECWAEDPSQRPDFDTIYTRLDELEKGFRNRNLEAQEKQQPMEYATQNTNYESISSQNNLYQPKYSEGNLALYGNSHNQ